MKLQDIILSGVSQSQESPNSAWFSNTWRGYKGQGIEEEGHGKLFNYDGDFSLEDEKNSGIIGGDGYTTMLMYLIPLNKYIKKWLNWLNLMLHMPIIIKTKE